MNIENKQPLFEPNRIPLYAKVPLDAPMSVTIEPSSICNFQCAYCAQALGKDFEQRHFHRQLMSMDIFDLVIRQLKSFGKIKKIHLFRNGEPLCNPNLAKMVKKLREENICETINISTNASLLTPEISDALIEAGLSSLSVSLNGLSGEQFQKTCGADVDFEQIYQNLAYFYEHKKHCKLFIKIIDIALLDKTEEARFYQLFSPIADRVYVETAVPVYESIDYSHMLRQSAVTRSGIPVKEPVVCQIVFFHMHILANGDVVPCNSIEFPIHTWNIQEKTLYDIWNSQERTQFLWQQLEGNRKQNRICANCQRLCQEYQPQDGLDEHMEEIKVRWKEKYERK